MKTTKEMIEIMQAYESGKQIQMCDLYANNWKNIESPEWDWINFDYRVKPNFKDGDILFIKSFCSWILIYKENKDKKNIYKYVAVSIDTTDFLMFINDSPLCYEESISEIRFATEDEKQKLFNVVKANGYHWNDKTKTLEKLIESKSKIGDCKYTITDEELCNLDNTICEWLLPRLKAFKEKTNGYPAILNSSKEWDDILGKIILALELYNSDLLNNQERARSEKIKEGFELFSKYFRNLWW